MNWRLANVIEGLICGSRRERLVFCGRLNRKVDIQEVNRDTQILLGRSCSGIYDPLSDHSRHYQK